MDMTDLRRLGLQESEIKIYVALLKRGFSTATEIAQSTKLNRSHIYDKLDKLLERGLVSFVIKNNVKYFKASDPEKILDYLKGIQTSIENIIPDLNKMKSFPKPKTVVELYQGKEGMKTVLNDILRERKDYCVFGEEGKFQEIFPIFIKQLLRDIKNYNLYERLLSKESRREKILVTPENSEIRYLPDKYFSPVMTAVYGSKLAIFIWSEPLFAILIKDKGVARCFKNYFDILWKIAKK